jgi:hypothetical protein
MAKKLIGIALAIAIVGVVIGLYIGDYLLGYPKAFAASGAGGVNLTLASVPAAGPTTSHPTWVSYFAVDSHGRWHHTTIYRVPANSLVHVTILQYDGASGLRNSFISEARGLVGSTFTVNGKPTVAIDFCHRQESLHCGALHARRGPRDNHFHLPHGQARDLPLAVPGAVRGGLHPGLRRTDGDDRLHGRLRPGGLSSPARWPSPTTCAASGSSGCSPAPSRRRSSSC